MSKKALVLIVSSSVSDTEIISACIAQHYQFNTANDAEQCLQIASHKVQPDIIVLDIEMLGTTGYEICERLKADENTSQIPIIFVSDSATEKRVNLGLALGAVDFLIKPIIPALAVARITTHVKLKLQLQKLSEVSCNDPLTGLYNRHLLADLGAKKVARAIRHKYNLWLLTIEVDNFKNIIADYGRDLGDKLLIQITELLKADNRKEDILARSTAEQFVVMFDPCGDIDAHNKALRISDEIGKLMLQERRITVSIGIAKLLDKDMDYEDLLKRADDALVRAKQNTLKRIEFAASY